MRIALVSAWYWPKFGGTETAIATLASSLRARGHQVIVHTRRFGRSNGTEYGTDGVEIRRYRELPGAAFFPETRSSDVVHLHGTDRTMLTICAVSSRAPIVTLHNGLGRKADEYVGQRNINLKTAFDGIVARTVLAKYGRVVCLHEEERDRMLNLGVSAGRLAVIPNAVPLEAFAYNAAPDTSAPYFVVLGRLAPDKGIDLVIDAAGAFGFRLVVIGDGASDYRAILKERAARSSAHVEFAGYLVGKDKYDLMAGASGLLVGSPYEGQSIAILEAMALRIPVCAAPDASRGLIVDGTTGFTHDLTAQGVGKCVERIKTDRQSVAELTARAGKFVRSKFHPDHVVSTIEALYAAAAAG